MHELPSATLHFDPPYEGLIGGAILHGWLVPKAGFHYTDVRMISGPHCFPGVYGIPRKDLAGFFKSPQPHLLAGFAVTFNLPTGHHRLTLQGCTIVGEWETLDSIEREVTPAESQPDPESRPSLDETSFGEMLRILLRRMSTSERAIRDEAKALIEATPVRHHLQHPPRPFHGHLDQPQLWAHSVFGRLAITGWIFHENTEIKNVFATTDLQAVQRLPYGRETPFLASRPAAPAHAVRAGYDGFLDLPTQLPLPVTVRLYAELADGSWHLGSVARFNATDHEFAKQPFATFSPLKFWRAWRALRSAIKAKGWPVPAGRDYRQAVGSAWRDYRSSAPRARPQPSDVRIALPPPRAGSLECVHVITHNLNREGAPLFLLEYARHLHGEHGTSLRVTSGLEGPLRRDFEALGASVQVADTTAVLRAPTTRELNSALIALGHTVDLQGADLVVVNTLSAWWGVHLARQANRPVLFYIHESTPPRRFFRSAMTPGAIGVIEASFAMADRVSFLTAATERYYAGLTSPANRRLNPGWIDLAGIDRFRAGHSNETLRAQLGIAADRRLVINVGTVCERKGQHLFARAVDLLWRIAPELAASADFLMIGGRETAYDERLADFLAGLNRPNLRVVPETGDVYPYYGAADLFVCSSYEESFPRVVLEAMAFDLPIVSTDVHGIPEIARANQEALLVPPGDSSALALALQRLLIEHDTAAALGARARVRVAEEYDSRKLLPRHAALARELV